MSMPAASRLIRLSCGGSGTFDFDTLRTLGRRLPRVGVVLTGASPWTTWIDASGAEVRALHFPKRDHVATTRVTNDVGAFLRNQANGRAQGTHEGSVSSTHCVSPLLLQTTRDTKLLPVVQLRSGVILLIGDPYLPYPNVPVMQFD